MRLADVDEAIVRIEKKVDEVYGYPKTEYAEGYVNACKAAVKMLKSLSTVDAVPVKHGRWIYHPDWQADGECGYECSECGMGSDVDYPYCMLCGARMEREGR